MKYTIIACLLVFAQVCLFAQTEKDSTLEQGVLFSVRADSDDDFKFNVKGYGIEGGYYLLKRLGRRWSIGINFRIAYSQSERAYVNLIERDDFFTLDSIQSRLNGKAEYRNVSLAIPLKVRFHFSEKNPFFLVAGFNQYFNLINNSKLKYDLFEYNKNTMMNISELRDQQQDLKQGFLSRDVFLIGIGYKKNRLMIDTYFSGGSININHDFLGDMDKLSLVFNVHYRL